MNLRHFEILSLSLRYLFVLLVLYILTVSFIKTIWDNNRINTRGTSGKVPFIIALFSLSAFGLLAGLGSLGYDYFVLLLGLLVSLVVVFQFYFLYYFIDGIDEVILSIVDFLFVIGLVTLQRLSPELAVKQLLWFILGNIGLFFLMLFFSRDKGLSKWTYPMMVFGLLTLLAVLFFAEEEWGAKRYISIRNISVQPSEFFKLLFIVVLSYWLCERKNFLKNLPLFLFSSLSVILVVLHKDLGSALQYFIVFIFVYYISSSDRAVVIMALLAASLGSLLSYKIFPHVRVRLKAWRNPWEDVYGGGYQLAQSLIAIGSGGMLGLGLGLGEPHVIPASRTDFIFAAICEEFGLIVGLSIILLFCIILLRGMRIGLNASKASDMLLASGATITICIQAFIIIGGVTNLIPLTGITLPFVSYGGSSMFVSLCIIGIIEGISIKNAQLANKEGDIKAEGEGGNENN